MSFKPVIYGAASLAALICASPAAAQSGCGASYTVQEGDTLAEIAQRCGASVDGLVRANDKVTNPAILGIGWELAVPGAGEGQPAAGGDIPAYADGASPGAGAQGGGQYQVRQGDTMADLASRFGVTLASLLAANEGLDAEALFPGQDILIPGSDSNTPDYGERRVSTQPQAGAPGAPITVRGANFTPGQTVRIGAGEAETEYQEIERARVQNDGEVRADVTIPDWADPGEDFVFVIVTEDNRDYASRRVDIVERRDPDDPFENGAREGIVARGWVEDGVECPVLRTPGGKIYSLTSDDVRFTEGEYVEVAGAEAQLSICQQGATLDVESLREVEPPRNGGPGDSGEDAAREIRAEGWIRGGFGPMCPMLRTADGEIYSLTGDYEFERGQYAQVTGVTVEGDSECRRGRTTLRVTGLTETEPDYDRRVIAPDNDRQRAEPPRPDNPVFDDRRPEDRERSRPDDAADLRIEGVLTTEGVECPALRADDGQLWTLAGDTGRFGEGDRVSVTGSPAQISTCMQGETIEIETITAD